MIYDSIRHNTLLDERPLLSMTRTIYTSTIYTYTHLHDERELALLHLDRYQLPTPKNKNICSYIYLYYIYIHGDSEEKSTGYILYREETCKQRKWKRREGKERKNTFKFFCIGMIIDITYWSLD
jgi:hypothetical protein